MKKILAISLIAMTAVSAANAQIASKAYVDEQRDVVDAKITVLNGDAETTGSVAKSIADAIDQEYSATSTKAQSGTAVAGAIATISGTANSALQSVTANNDAGVVTNIAKDGTAVTMTKAKVTGSDIAANAGIAATQLADGVQTTLTNAAADHTALGDTTGLETTYGAGNDTIVEALAVVNSAASSGASNVKSVKVNGSALTPDANGAVDVTVPTGTMASESASDYYTKTAANSQFVEAGAGVTASSTNSIVQYDAQGLVTAGTAAGALATKDTIANADVASNAAIDISKIAVPTGTGSDGTHVLTATVSNGSVTGYKWEQITRATPAQQGGGD